MELRKEHPELFKNIIFMGQPSGTFDETIALWEIQEMSEKFPQAIWVRDLYPSALTDRVKLAMKFANFIAVWVADGMTPVCQLTDTEIAFLVKVGGKQGIDQIKRERMRETPSWEDVDLKCGPLEILRVSKRAHEFPFCRNRADQIVLKGMVRIGYCCYRPSYDHGKLMPTESEDWRENLKTGERKVVAGSHRIRDSWLANRSEWGFEEDGTPKAPDWSRCQGEAAQLEDPTTLRYLREIRPEGPKFMKDYLVKIGGTKIQRFVMQLDTITQEVVSDELLQLLNTDPKRQREERELKTRSEKGERLVVSVNKKIREIGDNRAKMNLALRGIDPGIEQNYTKNINKMTKRELLWSIMPRGTLKKGAWETKRKNQVSG